MYTIGPTVFFEHRDNEHTIRNGFLKHVRGGPLLVETEDQIGDAVNTNPQPIFLGPRIDFNYAVFHLTPPLHFPIWWQPGTSFGRDQVPQLLETWNQQHFQTLIFLKDDYIFYPPDFLSLIQSNYIRDDRYPRITVYHRKPGI